MQPLIGGILRLHSSNVVDTSSSTLISHGGAAIVTPRDFISSIRSIASLLLAPDLDSEMNFLAPRSTIHRVILRPSPPKPPAMRYVASLSNEYVGLEFGITLCDREQIISFAGWPSLLVRWHHHPSPPQSYPCVSQSA